MTFPRELPVPIRASLCRRRAILQRALLFMSLFSCAVGGAAQGRGTFRAFLDEGRTLHLVGTGAAETILVRVENNPASLTLDYRRQDGQGAPQTASFPLDAFDRLEILAGGGEDFVNVVDPEELLDTGKKILRIDGGDGDNTVAITHLPFQPETARSLRSLLDLSQQLESVAQRASEATSSALLNDTLRQIESVRTQLLDAAKSLQTDTEGQLFGPARELAERAQPRLIELSNSLLAQADAIRAQQEQLAADLSRRYDPTNGVFPRDDDREPPPQRDTEDEAEPPAAAAQEKEAEAFRVRAEALEQAGRQLGDAAREKIETSALQIERDAGRLEERAAGIEKRAEALATTADGLSVQIEEELTAASARVLAVVQEASSRWRGASSRRAGP